MKTKKFILFFASIFVLFSLINCKNNKLEGTYYYVRSESKDIFEVGRNIACSSIDKFEFKNGKCYLNIMGVERRLDYEVDNGKIYFENNKDVGEVGLTIIDKNTLQFMGCLFQKQIDSTTTHKEVENSENKNGDVISETKAVTIKEDSKEKKGSQLISPKSVIRNNQTDERIKGVIEKNSKEYMITKTDEAVTVASKSENVEYLFIPYTESVEGFTFYSDKGINEVKKELKKFQFNFISDYGYIEENGSSCYSVQLEKMDGKTKITYGYECD